VEHHYLLITKHHFGDQIKENEMGRACGTNAGEESCTQGHMNERDNLEDLGLDGRIILVWIVQK
jgi:hypothetical protein